MSVVTSWIEICFENLGYTQMYIKFPRFDEELPAILKKLISAMPGKESLMEMQAFVSELLFE